VVNEEGGDLVKALTVAAGVLAIAITVLICWHWDLGLLGSEHGIHGGYGFEILVGVFALLYIPIMLVRRARRQPQKKNDDRDGAP
jgi:uncharacterized membrane protein